MKVKQYMRKKKMREAKERTSEKRRKKERRMKERKVSILGLLWMWYERNEALQDVLLDHIDFISVYNCDTRSVT